MVVSAFHYILKVLWAEEVSKNNNLYCQLLYLQYVAK